MKRYYIYDDNTEKTKEISEKEALEQEKINNKAILSDNLEDWMQCKFIFIVNK